MSFLEGELKGEEEGSVCEDPIGRGGVRRGSSGDVQHEFGTGSAICRGGSRDDGEDQGIGTESREEKVMSSECGVRSENPKELNLRTPN